MKVTQPLALYQGKLLEINKLSPGEITRIKEAGVQCPVCEKAGSVIITEDGPLFSHSADHEPETRERAGAKKLLAEQLQYIFSQATIERNVLFTGQIADIALLHPKGARIAIRYITGNEGMETLALWREVLLQEKIHFLSLLDAGRLPKIVRSKEETQTRKLVIGKTESTLLALGEDLLYFQREGHRLHLAHISPRIRELARKTGGKRIGSVPAVFYRHNLNSLRLLRGRWYLDHSYNPPPAIAHFEERFPSELENRLLRLGI